MTLDETVHGSSVPSVWEGCANVNALCISFTLKSTPSASRAISAVAELLVDAFH